MIAPRSPFRLRLLFLATFAVAPTGLGAQDSVAALPAALLRRMAEAVDGDRTGHNQYLVTTTTQPYDVLASFPTQAAAIEFRNGHPGTRVAGPFYAAPDPDQPTPKYLTVGCYHDRTLTRYICSGDSTRASLPVAQVKEVIITVVAFDSTKTVTTHYDPDHADAFFFTQSAIDKFVVPYYVWVYGAQFGADLRNRSLHFFGREYGHD